ncbi:TPA: N-acetyltransferase 9 [Trebouxia sp. C0005]
MIAVKTSRRKGLAFEALTIFMAYAVEYLGITCFQAKIGLSNQSSMKLFGKLGYAEISRSKIFNEATLNLQICGHVKAVMNEQAQNLRIGQYDDGNQASALSLG